MYVWYYVPKSGMLGWVYFVLVKDIPLFLKYINKIKLNMYSVWHNYMFIIIIIIIIIIIALFYYWLLVSSSKGHHQANVYKILKMLVHIVQKRQFCGIPFTFISSLYNYYQPLDVLSVVSYVVGTMDVFQNFFLCLTNLK